MGTQVVDQIKQIEQTQERLRDELDRVDNYPTPQYAQITSQIAENELKLERLRGLYSARQVKTKMKIF